MNRQQRIESILREHFAPTSLNVLDESQNHLGHSGARPEGETHYRIQMTAPQLVGQTRLAQHRAVNLVLQGEFEMGMHALALEINTP